MGNSIRVYTELLDFRSRLAVIRSIGRIGKKKLRFALGCVLFNRDHNSRANLADMKTHNVATLPCGVEENKKPRSSITSGCALPTLSTVGALQLSAVFESHVIEHY